MKATGGSDYEAPRLQMRVDALRMPTHLKRPLAAVLSLALAAGHLPNVPSAAAQTPSAGVMTRADYEACQARDEASFRLAIEAVTVRALRKGLAGLDFPAVVAHEWRRSGMDAVMDGEVDKVADQLRSETGWFAMWGTLFSKEKAERIATDAAERVYRSDAVRKGFEGLANGIGQEVGQRMEIASSDAAEPATQCLVAFLGPRYGSTIARIVGKDATKDISGAAEKGKAGVSTGALMLEGAEGIAGAIVLLVRRQLSNMGARIGQRVVGAVLGRVIAVVAGGVGLVLIAKDVWDFRHGVIPIVASEMKSAETKAKVRTEIAKASYEQISEQMQEIGAKAADRIIEIWNEFRRAHAKVLEIAERSPPFKAFLETIRPDRLGRLDETVGIVLLGEGEAGVLKRLENGTLNRAVNVLEPVAIDIARDAKSLDAALLWADIAGALLPRVVEHELHRKTDPKEITKAELARLLGLPDRLAIGRLATLKAKARQPLLELDDQRLVVLARAFDTAELDTLARYLTGLEREAGQRVLIAVANTPAKMALLSDPRVRDAILASRNQAAAVGMMLRADGIFDVSTFIEDASLVRHGLVSPWLLWERYPYALSGLGALAFLLLLSIGRAIFGRRRAATIIVQQPSGDGGRKG